jgi:hypothetical protein
VAFVNAQEAPGMLRLTMSLGILLWTAVLLGQVQPASQTPQTTFPVKGTGLVSGQVIDAHGSGVANAVVVSTRSNPASTWWW